ncbi:oligomeric golgi complex component, COG2-domain-containing protein [Podospora conica]|nr:oligomeric golgi complex component, COG2-domain-containing protein [Schizothecium conicum]
MPPPPAPSRGSGAAFNLASSPSNSSANPPSSDSDSDADEDAPLPFPAALSRTDFLAPDFDPAAYLSALHTGGPTSRHQTLEDLRADLRDRSAAISAELLELVNANYTAFLGLGDELRGGEDRVEDVRVALLGFRRAVDEIRGTVRERRVEVGRLSGELKGVRGAVERGRRMLELDERVAGLEARLAVGSGGRKAPAGQEESDGEEGWGEESEDDEEEEEDEGFVGSSPAKLAALARDYVVVEQLADSLGRTTPFVKKMEERMVRCRNTIILDLNTATKDAHRAGARGTLRILRFLAVYRTLEAHGEAIQVLKGK